MSTPTDPYATFRPVIGAWVARIGALASVVIFGSIALFGPSTAGSSESMAILDSAMIAGLGIVMAAGLWRYARIRAVPSTEGITVVNLVRTHHLEWNQIVRVGFSGGSPWAMLELTDTDEVAMMAIQRSDGRKAREQASRLAALVEHHQR